MKNQDELDAELVNAEIDALLRDDTFRGKTIGDKELMLKDYITRTILEYEHLLALDNFKNDLEKEETENLIRTLRLQLNKINGDLTARVLDIPE